MGTTSLIIGLIVMAVALFPNLGYFILIPAAAGLIIGTCKIVRDGYCPWGISGIFLNAMSIILALFWTAIISVSTTAAMEEAIRDLQDRPEILQVIYPVAPKKADAPAQQVKHEQPAKQEAAPAAK